MYRGTVWYVDLHEGVKNIMKFVTKMRIIPSPQIHVRNELRSVIAVLDFVEILLISKLSSTF